MKHQPNLDSGVAVKVPKKGDDLLQVSVSFSMSNA